MRAAQAGPALFQLRQLPEQGIVLFIADLRRVQSVIEIIMALQLGAEPTGALSLLRRRLRCKKRMLLDRGLVLRGHRKSL